MYLCIFCIVVFLKAMKRLLHRRERKPGGGGADARMWGWKSITGKVNILSDTKLAQSSDTEQTILTLQVMDLDGNLEGLQMGAFLDGIQVLEHQLEVHRANSLVGIQVAEFQVDPSGGKKAVGSCLVETRLRVAEVEVEG